MSIVVGDKVVGRVDVRIEGREDIARWWLDHHPGWGPAEAPSRCQGRPDRAAAAGWAAGE